MPMSEEKYKDTFRKLNSFCREEDVIMQRTGAHTTYGVNNSSVGRSDLQIRLNRLALAVKAVGTQRAIAELFGRDFSDYCQLPNSTTANYHSNAFSNSSRPDGCWECRLINWKANADKVVEFFKATEVAFHRPVTANDFINVFRILGADTSEA